MEKEELSANRKRVQVQVTGMNCASCVAKIERHLKKKPGKVFESYCPDKLRLCRNEACLQSCMSCECWCATLMY